MLRMIPALTIAAMLLTGCRTVFIPFPINGVSVGTPAPAPMPAPVSDAAQFRERYEAMGIAYTALAAHMEGMDFNSPEWRTEAGRLAREWRDAIAVVAGTAQPKGEQWRQAWPLITSGLARYGFAADGIERAAAQNNPAHMANVRSYLIEGTTFLGDAMALLGDSN